MTKTMNGRFRLTNGIFDGAIIGNRESKIGMGAFPFSRQLRLFLLEIAPLVYSIFGEIA